MNERTVNMLREITTAVNRGGMDTALDMPDYVIAGYLYRCLMALKLSKEETQTFFITLFLLVFSVTVYFLVLTDFLNVFALAVSFGVAFLTIIFVVVEDLL